MAAEATCLDPDDKNDSRVSFHMGKMISATHDLNHLNLWVHTCELFSCQSACCERTMNSARWWKINLTPNLIEDQRFPRTVNVRHRNKSNFHLDRLAAIKIEVSTICFQALQKINITSYFIGLRRCQPCFMEYKKINLSRCPATQIQARKRSEDAF